MQRKRKRAVCAVKSRSALAGKRLVRGREEECRAHYALLTEGEHA